MKRILSTILILVAGFISCSSTESYNLTLGNYTLLQFSYFPKNDWSCYLDALIPADSTIEIDCSSLDKLITALYSKALFNPVSLKSQDLFKKVYGKNVPEAELASRLFDDSSYYYNKTAARSDTTYIKGDYLICRSLVISAVLVELKPVDYEFWGSSLGIDYHEYPFITGIYFPISVAKYSTPEKCPVVFLNVKH